MNLVYKIVKIARLITSSGVCSTRSKNTHFHGASGRKNTFQLYLASVTSLIVLKTVVLETVSNLRQAAWSEIDTQHTPGGFFSLHIIYRETNPGGPQGVFSHARAQNA